MMKDSAYNKEVFSTADEITYNFLKATYLTRGIYQFRSGMALGFDTIVALVVLKLKKEYPNIKLIANVPCYNQDKLWSATDRERYREIW